MGGRLITPDDDEWPLPHSGLRRVEWSPPVLWAVGPWRLDVEAGRAGRADCRYRALPLTARRRWLAAAGRPDVTVSR